jgi:hypothetical protein
MAAVDRWRAAQTDVPNRSRAIRRMVLRVLREDGIEVPDEPPERAPED